MAEASAQIRVPIERSAPDAIRLERLLAAPPETVWRYLTEAHLRERWFMCSSRRASRAHRELKNCSSRP